MEAKASPVLLVELCWPRPWGHLQSGGTRVLVWFWAVLGHQLEGLAERQGCGWEREAAVPVMLSQHDWPRAAEPGPAAAARLFLHTRGFRVLWLLLMF